MGAIFFEMLKLLAIDLVFVGILVALLVPLASYRKAAYAVLKRNFVGYFSNPTGYVFLCLFVLLTSLAAFWPHEFFVANLANLDQLNKWLPWIMLIFIPAITMSIWADERRQGTDELLLTLPAGDFDIVIGKYLAAAAIFTVSLIFSQLANYSVLVSLTYDQQSATIDIDTGLFFTTYFGYWLIGLAMLAIGMVASFLTSNLTVSFILGLALNSILVFTHYADTVIPASATARQVSRWSFASQFDDFGRGVVSFSAIAFFLLIASLGVYLSVVMIGRRHWSGGRDGQSLWWHYLLRAVALVVVLIGANMILERYDYLRFDTTKGQVSSLSPDTRALLNKLASESDKERELRAKLAKLDAKSDEYASTQRQIDELEARRTRPVTIDAFISANVPEEYIKTRYNLVSMLKELRRQAGSRIQINIHDNLEPFSETAAQAEERYGITKQRILSRARGSLKEEEFILGAAITSGRETVVIPFFGAGMPVEYELIRSIATVGRGERKRLGVVQTDAQLNGGFSMAGMQPRQIPKQLILQELEKQYRIEDVDATNPIEAGKYDVLLVVQPSSLGPPQLSNLVEAVKRGQPTAIFEDPFPRVMAHVPGTAQPKQAQGGMFGMGGQAEPKGDMRPLWNALGIEVTGDTGNPAETPAVIVWQDYNPYPKFQLNSIGPELVFLRNDAPGTKNAFNPTEPVTAGFEELFFPFPTGMTQKSGSQLDFTELVSTSSTVAGEISVDVWQQNSFDPYLLASKMGQPTGHKYILAAWVRADKDAGDEQAADENAKDNAAAGETGEGEAATTVAAGINAIYVGDIDLLDSQFVELRNLPNPEFDFRFDNVPFVLNVIDAVAGDERFLRIRTRKPRHSTLRLVEDRAAAARKRESEAAEKFRAQFEREEQKAKAEELKAVNKFQAIVTNLQQKQQAGEQVDPAQFQAMVQQVALVTEREKRKAEVQVEELRIKRDQALAASQRERDQQVRQVQNDAKLWATTIPVIPPLLVGLIVWVRRRMREREGVSRSRMK
ncbi:MAG: Gldg family protein [Pirellulaceae bacterium]